MTGRLLGRDQLRQELGVLGEWVLVVDKNAAFAVESEALRHVHRTDLLWHREREIIHADEVERVLHVLLDVQKRALDKAVDDGREVPRRLVPPRAGESEPTEVRREEDGARVDEELGCVAQATRRAVLTNDAEVLEVGGAEAKVLLRAAHAALAALAVPGILGKPLVEKAERREAEVAALEVHRGGPSVAMLAHPSLDKVPHIAQVLLDDLEYVVLASAPGPLLI
mmetsp:Transcript_26925/g.86516  ORF Transcript_26925/g.86516 Transcript_26925/m.86516 type:complete len:225 (+) Transcript_26925:529-1203(+)